MFENVLSGETRQETNTLFLYVSCDSNTVHESIRRVYMDREAFPEKVDFAFTIASGMPRRKKEDTSFAPRLTAIRQARGMTQVQLAEAAGSTQRSISYYENDDGIPPASVVIVVAKALKVSTDELLGIKPRVEP